MGGTLIMKFGGSTVGTPTALTQVLSIVLHEVQHWDQLVLVASALDGVTDALIEAAHLAQLSNQRGYRRITATLRTRHLALVEKLPLGTVERNALQTDIDSLLFDMLDKCQSVADTPTDNLTPEASDAIIGVGERLSARIIAALLRQNKLRGVAIDATDIVITDNVFGHATPILELTQQRIDLHLRPMLDRDIIPVITGFIGATATGAPTTLGRGGSDYTASILSVCIQADELWVWVDVDGMMSSDPDEIKQAKVIPEMSYTEVAELAYFGARILHAHMIMPLKKQHIPLRIRNVYKPQTPGTLIHDMVDNHQPNIKAVTTIQGIALTADATGRLSDMTHFVDGILNRTIGSRANVIFSSQSASHSLLCFIIPTSAGMHLADVIQNDLEKELTQTPDHNHWDVQPVSIITAIGSQMSTITHLTGNILQSLNGIQVLGLAQGPSQCSLSVIVRPEDADQAIHQIHNLTL